MLVNCEDCYFALKVWNAHNAGATAVLVSDDREEPLITMDSPEKDSSAAEYLQNITNPSALIEKEFGDKLKGAINKGDMVNINLDWRESVPHPDDRVEYELWTNSNDECGSKCDTQLEFALDGCHNESVNTKVLQLFVNLLTGDPSYINLKQTLQEKLLLMDSSSLSTWLEKRLLGCTVQSAVGNLPTGVSNSARDSAIAFINALVLPSSDSKSRVLCDHILDALLVGLEKAFLSFDVPTAKAYFNFVVQLANGEPTIKPLIKRAIDMVVKLSADETHLEGLKFILGFLVSALGAYGANKHVSEKSTEKPWSNISSSNDSASCKLKSNVPRKNSEALVNPVNQGVHSTAIECDATSAEEDEDDGTSDGELTSMGKEDDDESNSERSLASKGVPQGSQSFGDHGNFFPSIDVKNFKGAAQILEKSGYTQFTPHYITWYCPQAFTISKQCKAQCINHGRYCAPDPEQDFSRGYDGKDVVLENLRQLCIFKVANESNRPWAWWDYVTDFHIRCPMKEKKYTKECAENVIQSLGLDNKKRVETCMGDPNADTDDPVLKQEQDAQVGHGSRGDVTILPTLIINNRQYRGKLDKGPVLKAICAGFQETTEPTVCLSDDMETNECLKNNGGCWQDKKSNITACKDTFRGRVCECPLVDGVQFKGDGYSNCEGKKAEEGKVGWAAVWVVLLGLVAAAAGAYVIYKYRLRSYMDSEIRAIMAQYMPLDSQGEIPNHVNNETL